MFHAANDRRAYVTEVDDILPNAAVCPELTVAKQAAISSPEAARYFATVDAFLESIAKPLGIAVSDTEVGALFVRTPTRERTSCVAWPHPHLADIVPRHAPCIPPPQDCSYVHLCHSKAMPEAITEDVFNQIVNLVRHMHVCRHCVYRLPYHSARLLLHQTQFEENFLYTYNNSRYARLGMGALIAEAHKNMLNMIAGDSLPFWLYSGHDTVSQAPPPPPHSSS